MSDKKTEKPSKEIKQENPEVLENEDLDDAHGGASLSRTSISSSNLLRPVGTSITGNTVSGGLNFDTVYGGTSGLTDSPLKR